VTVVIVAVIMMMITRTIMMLMVMSSTRSTTRGRHVEGKDLAGGSMIVAVVGANGVGVLDGFAFLDKRA
jgi:hypothetical protein